MMVMKMIRTYTDLIALPTFEERFEYLRLDGKVGEETFGFDRWINQQLYHHDAEWRKARRIVIARDNGCDLAHPDRPIPEGYKIIVHHMNPITVDDIQKRSKYLFDPEFLITVMDSTHNAIHYGDETLLLRSNPIQRSPNDTCPWR